MANERETYESRGGLYHLNIKKIFDVVENLVTYLRTATNEAEIHNRTGLLYSKLGGVGKKLIISTGAEVINRPGTLRRRGFTLAELVLSPDNKQLTLEIHSHPRVVIPSEGFHSIGRDYSLKIVKKRK